MMLDPTSLKSMNQCERLRDAYPKAWLTIWNDHEEAFHLVNHHSLSQRPHAETNSRGQLTVLGPVILTCPRPMPSLSTPLSLQQPLAPSAVEILFETSSSVNKRTPEKSSF
jgi:hypothetical protein